MSIFLLEVKEYPFIPVVYSRANYDALKTFKRNNISKKTCEVLFYLDNMYYIIIVVFWLIDAVIEYFI